MVIFEADTCPTLETLNTLRPLNCGALLNIIGQLAHTWTQGKYDRKLVMQKQHRDIGMPSVDKYKYDLLSSLVLTISQILLSIGTVATIILFSDFFFFQS